MNKQPNIRFNKENTTQSISQPAGSVSTQSRIGWVSEQRCWVGVKLEDHEEMGMRFERAEWIMQTKSEWSEGAVSKSVSRSVSQSVSQAGEAPLLGPKSLGIVILFSPLSWRRPGEGGRWRRDGGGGGEVRDRGGRRGGVQSRGCDDDNNNQHTHWICRHTHTSRLW